MSKTLENCKTRISEHEPSFERHKTDYNYSNHLINDHQ